MTLLAQLQAIATALTQVLTLSGQVVAALTDLKTFLETA